MTACVIDTSAILAYAFAERGATKIERWIDAGGAASALAVQETVSRLRRTGMLQGEADELALALGLQIHVLDLDLATGLAAWSL